MTTEPTLIQHGSIAITTNPNHPELPYRLPGHLQPFYAKALKKVNQNSKSAQKQLEQWMAGNPGVPQFKHLLAQHFAAKKDREQAVRLNGELLHDYPGFLYAPIHLAIDALNTGHPGQVKDFLGPKLSLADLYPQRKVFHFDEYVLFVKVLIYYYCELNELNQAELVLDDLRDVASDLGKDDRFTDAESHIFLAKFRREEDGFPDLGPKDPIMRETPTLPQTTDAPVFRLPQTIQLYRHGFHSMPDKVIHELLTSDRELLRLDLEDVLRDAIRRYEYFRDGEVSFETSSAPLHTLFLLKEIEAEESLPVVLELLRQPEEVLEFWLGDMLTEDLRSVLYTLGFNHLPHLAAFLKEPLNYTYARSEVSAALQQVALHHPERRAEVLALYNDLLVFYITHSTDASIVDPTLVGFVISDLGEMGGRELLPLIKTLYDAYMVNTSLMGGFHDVKKLMNENVDSREQMKDYFKIKQELGAVEKNWLDQEQPDPSTFPRQSPNEKAYDDSVEREEVDEAPAGTVYSGDTPFIKKDPKIGRNDPCYCGSGKKYKHCHGKS